MTANTPRTSTSNTLRIAAICPACKAEFSRKRDLVRHEKARHDKDRIECKLCNRTFSRKDSLVRHRPRCPRVMEESIQQRQRDQQQLQQPHILPPPPPPQHQQQQQHLPQKSQQHSQLEEPRTPQPTRIKPQDQSIPLIREEVIATKEEYPQKGEQSQQQQQQRYLVESK